ncbi:hypothetical protein [Pantoea ananatis]|nr:hypothetical protein [Pantoea ananatis]
MLFHQLNDWLCTGLNGCVNIWHRLLPLGSIVECVIVISIMGWLLSKIYGWRPVIYSVVLAVLINLFMYVRLSAGHLPQGDAAMFALFSGFILIICLAFEALLIRDYPRLRYGLRLMMALLSGCMTLALWLQAGVRA